MLQSLNQPFGDCTEHSNYNYVTFMCHNCFLALLKGLVSLSFSFAVRSARQQSPLFGRIITIIKLRVSFSLQRHLVVFHWIRSESLLIFSVLGITLNRILYLGLGFEVWGNVEYPFITLSSSSPWSGAVVTVSVPSELFIHFHGIICKLLASVLADCFSR